MANMSGDDLVEIIKKCSVILLDVAGTTTSIDFVQKTLHSYVVDNANKYITEHWNDETVQETVTRLQSGCTDSSQSASKEDKISTIVNRLIKPPSSTETDEDLKTLHGIIYEQGYESGDLKGHVYEDVVVALRDWTEMKKRICVYSSGSVRAQRLLFSKSVSGDLSSHITEYFDLSIGSKTEKDSYAAIANKLDCTPNDIIFLTDSVAEAEAASKAGIRPVVVSRNTEKVDNASLSFPVVHLLTELPSSNAQKRKHPDDSVEEQEDRTSKVAKIDEKEKEKSATAVNGVEKLEIVETFDKVDQKENLENDKKTELEIKKTDSDPKQTETPIDKTAQVENGEEDEKMDTSDIPMVVDEDERANEQETNVKENAQIKNDNSSTTENEKSPSDEKNVNVDKESSEVISMEELGKEKVVEELVTESHQELNQKDTKETSEEKVIEKSQTKKPSIENPQTEESQKEGTQIEASQKKESHNQEAQVETSEKDESHKEEPIEKVESNESQIEKVQNKKSDVEVSDDKIHTEISDNKGDADIKTAMLPEECKKEPVKVDDKANSGAVEMLQTEPIKEKDVKKTDSDKDIKSDKLDHEKEKSDNVEELEKVAHEAKYKAKKVECETAQKELDVLLKSLDTIKCKLSEVKREHDAIQQQFESTRLQVEDATSKLKEAERILEIVNQERLLANKKLVSQLKDENGEKSCAETKNGMENGISSLNGKKESKNQMESETKAVIHNGDASNCIVNNDELSKLEKCETDAIMTEIPVAVAVGSSD